VAESVESDVLRRQLDNGLTVLLKRHSVLPMVSVQAFVRGGVLSDTAETSGRASLATSLMEKGTKKYSAEQIAEYFDSIGGSLSLNSQRNTSYLQCTVLKEDFQPSLDYVHQVLFRPTFPEAEFDKARRLQLGRITKRMKSEHNATFEYTDDVVAEIVRRCNDPASGGRMIDNIITNTMLPAISLEVLNRSLVGEEISSAHVSVAEGDFAYEVK